MLKRLAFALAGLWLAAGPVAAGPKASDLVHADIVADGVRPGGTTTVGVRLRMKQHWHTYWRNPGDSGLATEIGWRLPAGWSAGGIIWPTPQRIPVSHLVNYGYEDEVVLLTEITAPADAVTGGAVEIGATINYLVCERECIPGEATLSARLPVVGPGTNPSASVLAAARASLPVPAPWPARVDSDADTLVLTVDAPGLRPDAIRSAYLFPNDEAAIDHAAPQSLAVTAAGLKLTLKRSALAAGDPPRHLPGTLVLTEALEGGSEARQAFLFGPPASAPAAAAAATSSTDTSLTSLALAAGLALLGGLILNLMPCVFPVLSIKVLSLVTYSGRSPRSVRIGAVAYTAGVLVSFLALAGLLLAIRAGGAEIGWGFQLQAPGFVAALAFGLFALGLSLSGVHAFGGSLAGIGGRFTGGSGLGSSFGTGVLAAVVATPCTAPFMGAALGYALTAPIGAAFVVFGALGFGLALPFLVLALRPSLLNRLPRPGAWMDRLKQALAFPVYATVAWLVFVLSQQIGGAGLFAALIGLVFVGFAMWLLRIVAESGAGARVAGRMVVAVAVLAIVAAGYIAAGDRVAPETSFAGARAVAGDGPEPFTQARLDGLRGEGRAVFVNMTAAWCITCLVNERTALGTAAVRRALAERGVAYLKGDWTNQNPEITRLLVRHGRSGVPLYVLYPAQGEAAVLPQILTEAIVLDHLGRLPGPETRRAALSATSTGADP